MVNGYFAVDELGEKDALIRIDQDALDKIESDESERINADKSGKELVESQREKFNTVGKNERNTMAVVIRQFLDMFQ